MNLLQYDYPLRFVLLLTALPGIFLMNMAAGRFLRKKNGPLCQAIILFMLFITIVLPSWIGDENPLLLFPFFMAAFYLCHRGSWYTRMTLGGIFYIFLLSLNMIMDSFINSDVYLVILKTGIWSVTGYLLWRFVPSSMRLLTSPRLWGLLAGLTLAPLFTTLSFSIWNYNWFGFQYDIITFKAIINRYGYFVLPFMILTALSLLAAVVVLSRHEELQLGQRLQEMQAAYYQGIQREQTGIRMIRHDLNNHIAVIQNLLEQNDAARAANYLSELSGSDILSGSARICENDIVNAILSGKTALMERHGIAAEWAVSLPPDLTVADIDLCALFGNALDNAIEAARFAADKHILVCARADKGILMLQVENTYDTPLHMEHGRFRTTKADTAAHGLGLRGMQEIARRYGGSLAAETENGRFILTVYLML